MNNIFFIAQAPVNSRLLEIVDKFGLNWYDFVAQIVCFLILAYVLNRFVFKPVMAAVEQRRLEALKTAENNEKINSLLKETEESKAEIMRKAHEHAEKIISETKKDAVELEEKNKRRAEEASAQLLAKAREEIDLQRKQMKIELKNEMAELITLLTSKLIKKNFDEEDRKRLTESTVKDITEKWAENEDKPHS